MKYVLISLAFLSNVFAAFGNTPPTPQVLSAAMRDGTTIMDITYRVDDPDDATVKVRALAFVDGVRSFANVLRPSSFVDGTDANLGDAIPANTDLALAWDVGADWEIDLGQVKFEILAMDGRGLLAFDWITIPATDEEAELTISKDTPSDAAVLDALFWQYADEDTKLTLENGVLTGDRDGFSHKLVDDTEVQVYGSWYILEVADLGVASTTDIQYAVAARALPQSVDKVYAKPGPWNVSAAYSFISWGDPDDSSLIPPIAFSSPVEAISAGGLASGGFSLALLMDGTIIGWGNNNQGQATPPSDLSNVIAISAGGDHSLALKDDGTVVAWGNNSNGETTIPTGLTNVIAIAADGYAGGGQSLALKSNGTVVGWGRNDKGQATPPAGLTDVVAIAAGALHSVALKNDGTVVGWGSETGATPPAGLTGVVAIAAGGQHSIALKNDGTVVGWGSQGMPPEELSGVIAIDAGGAGAGSHSVALKDDGTVICWGSNTKGQATPPEGLHNVIAISAGMFHTIAYRAEYTTAP